MITVSHHLANILINPTRQGHSLMPTTQLNLEMGWYF
jgi:hypothetical protein